MHNTRSTLFAGLVVVGLAHAAAAQAPADPSSPPAVATDPAPVAAAPPVAPTPPATTPPATTPPGEKADDFDLASVGLDPNAAFDDKLNIYGFADVSYQVIHFKTPTAFVSDTRGFNIGNLDVYLAKNLTRKWRTLAEVRFLFAPNGS